MSGGRVLKWKKINHFLFVLFFVTKVPNYAEKKIKEKKNTHTHMLNKKQIK